MISNLRRRAVAFAFHLLYNQFAFSYDLVSNLVSLGKWRQWQRSVFQFLNPSEADFVLELAHGTGNLQLDLLNASYRTIALDLSPTMGRVARNKLRKDKVCTDLLRGSALSLPFGAASIPAIVCTFPAGFIFHQQTLNEMRRVLTGDGRAIIVLSAYLTGGGLVRNVIKGLYRLTLQQYGDPVHESICHQFRADGFNIELPEVECDGSLIQLAIMRKLPAAL